MRDTKQTPPFDTAQAVAHLGKADKRLGTLMKKVGPCALTISPLKAPLDPFRALAESIMYQQLNGKAAATIVGRFRDQIGGGDFPEPKVVLKCKEETLRACGLSGAKTAAILDLAAKIEDGTVPKVATILRMDDDEIVERLVSVRGIGRWTVEMMLIFSLGRPDVLPVGDYGVRKGFAKTYHSKTKKDELPTPAQLTEHGERWRPYRTIGSWYMWRALELTET